MLVLFFLFINMVWVYVCMCVAKRWSAVNYLSRTVPFLVALPNINHWTFFSDSPSLVSTRARNSMSQRISNVTSIINVISKVIVVDACNKTEKIRTKKPNRMKWTQYSVVDGIFFSYEIKPVIYFSSLFLFTLVLLSTFMLFLLLYDMQLMYWTHENIFRIVWKRFVLVRARENLYSSHFICLIFSQTKKRAFFSLFLFFFFFFFN